MVAVGVIVIVVLLGIGALMFLGFWRGQRGRPRNRPVAPFQTFLHYLWRAGDDAGRRQGPPDRAGILDKQESKNDS